MRAQALERKQFDNLAETTMDVNLKTMPGLIKAQFTDRKSGTRKTDSDRFRSMQQSGIQNRKTKVHLVRTLSSAASIEWKKPPYRPDVGARCFAIALLNQTVSENSIDVIDQLPKIDAVLCTRPLRSHRPEKRSKTDAESR